MEVVCFYHFEGCLKQKFPRGISCKHIFSVLSVFINIIIIVIFLKTSPITIFLRSTNFTRNCTELISLNLRFSGFIFTNCKIFPTLIVSVNVFFVHLLSRSRCFGLCVPFPSSILGIRHGRK